MTIRLRKRFKLPFARFNRPHPAPRTNAIIYICMLLGAAGMASCSNIDCPLSNSVSAKYIFYNSAGKASAVVKDTLTVKAAGTDTILFNRGVNLTEVNLPMSYRQNADTLLFCISNTGESRTDTVVVGHTNEAHFESIDCSPSMFHKITSVTLKKGSGSENVARIDSVALNNPKVNYNVAENFKVYITLP